MIKFSLTLLITIAYCSALLGQNKPKDTIDIEVATINYLLSKSKSLVKNSNRINYLSIKDSTIKNTLNEVMNNINKSENKYKILAESHQYNNQSVHFSISKLIFPDSTMKAVVDCGYFADLTTFYYYKLIFAKKRNRWKVVHWDLGVVDRVPDIY